MSFGTVQQPFRGFGPTHSAAPGWAPSLAGILARLGFDPVGMRLDTYVVPGCSGADGCVAPTDPAAGRRVAEDGS